VTLHLCPFCGRRPIHEHDHLTGRKGSKDAPYFDPDLTVPCCHHCNRQHAQLWRLLNLGKVGAVPAFTRLQRLAAGLHRLGTGPGAWAPPASWWMALGRCLAKVSDDLGGAE
jgi:hypothetical protein